MTRRHGFTLVELLVVIGISALLISIRVAMASWGWRPDDVLAHALPLFHQHGLGGVHAVLIAGGTAHIASRFSAAGLAIAVRQHHPGVPLHRLVILPAETVRSLGRRHQFAPPRDQAVGIGGRNRFLQVERLVDQNDKL